MVMGLTMEVDTYKSYIAFKSFKTFKSFNRMCISLMQNVLNSMLNQKSVEGFSR